MRLAGRCTLASEGYLQSPRIGWLASIYASGKEACVWMASRRGSLQVGRAGQVAYSSSPSLQRDNSVTSRMVSRLCRPFVLPSGGAGSTRACSTSPTLGLSCVSVPSPWRGGLSKSKNLLIQFMSWTRVWNCAPYYEFCSSSWPHFCRSSLFSNPNCWHSLSRHCTASTMPPLACRQACSCAHREAISLVSASGPSAGTVSMNRFVSEAKDCASILVFQGNNCYYKHFMINPEADQLG